MKNVLVILCSGNSSDLMIPGENLEDLQGSLDHILKSTNLEYSLKVVSRMYLG